MTELEQHWTRALEAATDALGAAAAAHSLPPTEVGARWRRLDLERAWLATVDWTRFGQSCGATIAVLEAPSKVARARLVRPAASGAEQPMPAPAGATMTKAAAA
jgi:hypothetical protein